MSDPERRVQMVQVKSNSTQGELGPFCDAARNDLPWPAHVQLDFIIWYDRKGPRLLRPTADGHTERYDGREAEGMGRDGLV